MPPERDELAASSAAEEATQSINPDATADSSTAVEGATESGSPTDDKSDGSNGDSGQDEQSLLDVISDAAGPGEDSTEDGADADSEQDQSESEDDKSEDESEDDADSDGEDGDKGDKPEPFHKHPRWQEMIRERDTYRQQVEDLQPKAQEFDKINQFMQDNELSAQEVADGLQVVALMKNDPGRARDILAERMQSLDEFAGHKLPDDLQRDVEEGYISEDRAQELARLRNEKEFANERRERTERKSQEQLDAERQQRQQDQARQVIQDQRTAIQDWESKLKAKDPDYGRIQSFVARELRFQVQQNPPRNVDEAVQLAEKAYKSVKDDFKKAMPERPEVRQTPRSDQSGASSASSQQPASFMDAIQQAADQS